MRISILFHLLEQGISRCRNPVQVIVNVIVRDRHGMIEKPGIDSRYIMLSSLSLEDRLSYVERTGDGLVRNRAERQEIVQLKRYCESKHVACRCLEEEDTRGLSRVANCTSVSPRAGRPINAILNMQ